MWLLSTDRAELHYFSSPEDVEGGYAILSHVWNMDGPEQSFEDTERLAATLKRSTECPRDRASRKVRESCVLAEKHGFHWLWVDTCCIDKKSSTELSEAINSMFRYYQLACICYVYLYDVVVPQPLPTSSLGRHGPSPLPDHVSIYDRALRPTFRDFRDSKRHTRGWTLQELLASPIVAFFSRDWKLLGSKADLSPLLGEITRIPQSVLTLETPLSGVSVSERMRWAARRKTTRPEDEAYCLLGIFDINMPLLYGEGGSKAFLRLQNEIMKHSPDTTLFAWTRLRDPLWLGSLSLQETLANLSKSLDTTANEHTHSIDSYATCLFAHSLRDFDMLSDLSMRFNLSHFEEIPHSVMPREPIASSGLHRRPADLPMFSTTPYGVLAHIPVIKLHSAQVLVALLGWTSSVGKRYGLLLTRCPKSDHLYSVGITARPGQRLLQIDQQQPVYIPGIPGLHEKQLPPPNWMDVYILPSIPQDESDRTIRTGTTTFPPLAALTASFTSPFRFTQHNLENLRLGEESEDALRLHLISCKNLYGPWTGLGSPMTIAFSAKDCNMETHEFIVLRLGRCSASSLWASGHAPEPHWAKICLSLANSANVSAASGSSDHDCSVDHVREWPGWKKQSVPIPLPQPRRLGTHNYCRMVLSFSPCSINSTSLVGNIEVFPWPTGKNPSDFPRTTAGNTAATDRNSLAAILRSEIAALEAKLTDCWPDKEKTLRSHIRKSSPLARHVVAPGDTPGTSLDPIRAQESRLYDLLVLQPPPGVTRSGGAHKQGPG